jgi:hypothetical protein
VYVSITPWDIKRIRKQEVIRWGEYLSSGVKNGMKSTA